MGLWRVSVIRPSAWTLMLGSACRRCRRGSSGAGTPQLLLLQSLRTTSLVAPFSLTFLLFFLLLPLQSQTIRSWSACRKFSFPSHVKPTSSIS